MFKNYLDRELSQTRKVSSLRQSLSWINKWLKWSLKKTKSSSSLMLRSTPFLTEFAPLMVLKIYKWKTNLWFFFLENKSFTSGRSWSKSLTRARMAKECISDELACGLEEGGAKPERRQPTQGQHSLLGKPTQRLSVELNSLQDTHTAAKNPVTKHTLNLVQSSYVFDEVADCSGTLR